jgi:hypothetical protein
MVDWSTTDLGMVDWSTTDLGMVDWSTTDLGRRTGGPPWDSRGTADWATAGRTDA